MPDSAHLARRLRSNVACFAVVLSLATVKADTVLEVASPDGRIALAVSLDRKGVATYKVSCDGKAVVRPSRLGLVCTDGDFSDELQFIDCSDRCELRQQYELWTGPVSHVDHLLHHKACRLANAEGDEVLIDCVASDEGVALRYRFESPAGKCREVLRERTCFRFAPSTKGWLTPYHAAGEHTPNNEDYYFHVAVTDTPVNSRAEPKGWAMPALLEPADDGPAVLLCEASDVGSYCGCHLVQGADPGSFEIALALPDETHREPQGVAFYSTPASDTPWSLPWRVMLVGEPREFVESTLVTDLAPACKIADASWVQPGRASWGWLSQLEGPYKSELFNRFTDLAAEYGWEYTTFDGGWWDVDLKEISRYARDRRVKPLVWMYSGDCYDAKKRREKLDYYKSCGVAGVKIDFWATHLQPAMRAIRDTLEDAAERKMVVVLHGCPTPLGWQRTWPNLLSCEAVLGIESYIYDSRYPEKVAELNCVLPFTRNVAGPMDATPLRLTPLGGTQRTTTTAHELATPIVFSSGVIHYADSADAYNALPAEAQKLLRDAPARWDETRCLVGDPGEAIVVARRSGDDWYVAGLNGRDKSIELDVDLSALGAHGKTFTAITDSAEPAALDIRVESASRGAWRHAVQKAGGFVLIVH